MRVTRVARTSAFQSLYLATYLPIYLYIERSIFSFPSSKDIYKLRGKIPDADSTTDKKPGWTWRRKVVSDEMADQGVVQSGGFGSGAREARAPDIENRYFLLQN